MILFERKPIEYEFQLCMLTTLNTDNFTLDFVNYLFQYYYHQLFIGYYLLSINYYNIKLISLELTLNH